MSSAKEKFGACDPQNGKLLHNPFRNEMWSQEERGKLVPFKKGVGRSKIPLPEWGVLHVCSLVHIPEKSKQRGLRID